MRPRFAALFAFALTLTACGKGNFFATPAEQIALSPAVPGYSLAHAYGDSITFGVGVASPSLVYAALAASYNSVPLTNYALSGDESCDISTRQIFPHGDAPALASNGLYSLLIGTNDVDVRGAGAGEATFNLCYQAAVAWLATPQEYKLLASSPSVTVTGPSHIDTFAKYNAVTTDTNGASISFPFTRAAAAPVYLWYRVSDNNSNAFTCMLDGNLLPVILNAPTPQVFTQNGTNDSMAVLRIGTIPAGNHILLCTQNYPGASGMGLIAIGGPPPAGTLRRPRLLAGLLTPQLGANNHAAAIAAYDADIRNNVAIFAGDGLDVELFDSAPYLAATSQYFSDNVHPSAYGQQQIFAAFQLELNQPVPR